MFTMPFEKNTCVGSIDLNNGGIVDITDESIKEEVEVLPTNRASEVIVVRRYAVVVTNIRFHFLK